MLLRVLVLAPPLVLVLVLLLLLVLVAAPGLVPALHVVHGACW